MGQTTSFDSSGAAVDRAAPAIVAPTTHAATGNPLVHSAEGFPSSCIEMEAMLHTPTPSTQPPCTTDAAAEASRAATAPDAASTVSVFCLDVSKQSLLQLREVLETPPPQRAAAFHRVAKHSHGVLLNAPASTSLRSLQSFLVSQTTKGRRGDVAPSSLHVFALRDPTVVITNGTDAPVTVTREMSTDLLIPLSGSVELSALACDATVLAFATADASSTVQDDGVSSAEAQQQGTDGEVSDTAAAATAAARTIVLLYTRDSRFGFDGGDMLLIGCCVAICACIAAGICCCVSAAKKNKQQQQSSSANDGKPNGNNSGVPDYYNNTNYNNNNGNQNYYNNNNGYYGQSQQPNGNYGNPYAPTGYDNNNGGVNGYGAPPNAYQNNNNYQNQYQPQQYQPQQYQQQQNYGNNNNGGQPQGPAPL